MKLEDCPHCFTEVFPMAGRVCPACNEPFGPPSHWVTLVAHDQERLPRFCATCAAPTDRLEEISRKRVPEAEIPWWLLPLTVLLRVFGFPLIGASLTQVAAETRQDQDRVLEHTRSLKVEAPHCEGCAAKAPLDVRYIDFERARISVVAHRQYRDLVALGRRR